jgi:hypothetical protein
MLKVDIIEEPLYFDFLRIMSAVGLVRLLRVCQVHRLLGVAESTVLASSKRRFAEPARAAPCRPAEYLVRTALRREQELDLTSRPTSCRSAQHTQFVSWRCNAARHSEGVNACEGRESVSGAPALLEQQHSLEHAEFTPVPDHLADGS